MQPSVAHLLAAAAVIDISVFAYPWKEGQWPGATERLALRHGADIRSIPEPSACIYDSGESNAKAPLKNIFGQLEGSEIAAVTAFLHQQQQLNLTAVKDASGWDNIIDLVELLQPNKSAALPYMNGNGPIPDRYARAAIQFQATAEPYIQDFMVGPLPISEKTTVQPLNYYYNKGVGKQRVYHADPKAEIQFYAQIGASISDITLDLWNATFMGLPNDTMYIRGYEPLSITDDSAITWGQFINFPVGIPDDRASILPLGLHVKMNIYGRDPSKWSTMGWYYNGKFYKTTDAFRKAYFSPGFEKLPANVDGPWAQLSRDGDPMPRDAIPPPQPVMPQGRRFGVDQQEKYVEWMDFSFYVGFTRDTGMRLYDIKFKGERIIYELGLEEALSHYASDEPMQSGTAFLDTFQGFGRSAFELVKGYDCPSHSTFLNTSFFTAEETHHHINSICLFEMDSNHPLQRYASSNTVSVTKNIMFVMRSISAVANYDFMFDYEFYMDGSIHVTIRLSGYIQASYWAKKNDYGFRIRDNLSGSMHDHVLNYKVDMDINGTANSLLKAAVVPTRERYPWSEGEWVNTMKVQTSFVDNERHSKLNWGENAATFYTVVNKKALNKYGEFRGYRIAPVSSCTTYLTVKNSPRIKKSGAWATHNLYAVKQKDTEPHSASSYNNLDTGHPVVDFSKFFDGESLDQEDLVLYFNLGMHHVPDTSDLPNTVTTNAWSSMALIPQNFENRNPSRSTRQQVRITFGGGNSSKVEKFGSEQASCNFDMSRASPNLEDYRGDITVPKYPYAPSNLSYVPALPGS